MSKMVLSIGFLIIIFFVMSVYLGYTVVSDAAATITATVKHAIAAEVMIPANDGGGYVTEGLGGAGLNLDLPALTQGVNNRLTTQWPGAKAQEDPVQALTWVLPPGMSGGYHITGPVFITRITESTSLPPTLTAQVAIPIAVNFWMGVWTGTIQRTIVLPLAGQQLTNAFVPYTQAWFNQYQAAWTGAVGGTCSACGVSGPVIGPGYTPSTNVPYGVWFASQQVTVSSSGNYTVQAAADDAAAIWINGRLVATPSLQNGTVSALVPLTAGTVTIGAEVGSNGVGSPNIVPNTQTGAKPSVLSLSLMSPGGQAVASTNSASGWTIDAYPRSVKMPPGGQNSGLLP
jgi:hypothetical protein